MFVFIALHHDKCQRPSLFQDLHSKFQSGILTCLVAKKINQYPQCPRKVILQREGNYQIQLSTNNSRLQSLVSLTNSNSCTIIWRHDPVSCIDQCNQIITVRFCLSGSLLIRPKYSMPYYWCCSSSGGSAYTVLLLLVLL